MTEPLTTPHGPPTPPPSTSTDATPDSRPVTDLSTEPPDPAAAFRQHIATWPHPTVPEPAAAMLTGARALLLAAPEQPDAAHAALHLALTAADHLKLPRPDTTDRFTLTALTTGHHLRHTLTTTSTPTHPHDPTDPHTKGMISLITTITHAVHDLANHHNQPDHQPDTRQPR